MARGAEEFAAVGERLGQHFCRAEPRERVLGYLRGLLSDTERKNGWQLAEHLGDPPPDGVQHLLGRAAGDADAVRDDLTRYVAEHRGQPGGVLVVDETGFLKKGTKAVGVARPYSGTAGRIENCQVGVFLGYVTDRGRALRDRALDLPKEWTADRQRLQAAGVPTGVAFATKLVLARQMVERAVAAGVPAAAVTAAAVYGSDDAFRQGIEVLKRGSVVGVRTDPTVCVGPQQRRVKSLLAEILADGWHRRSCGDGAKGPRHDAWARSPLNSPEPQTYARWLLIRRRTADPAEVAYFVCGGAPGTAWDVLEQVAGRRWSIEECFESAQGDCGLDAYEGRGWVGWHRPVTLSLFALAVLAVIRARAAESPGRKKGRPV